MDPWAQLFKDVGFPIAVAAYVLVRLDTRLGELTRSVSDLVEEIRAGRKANEGHDH